MAILMVNVQSFGVKISRMQTFKAQIYETQTFGEQTFKVQTFGTQIFRAHVFKMQIFEKQIFMARIFKTRIFEMQISVAQIFVEQKISQTYRGQVSCQNVVVLSVGKKSGNLSSNLKFLKVQKEATQQEENADVVRRKYWRYKTLMGQKPTLTEYTITTITAQIISSEKSLRQTALMITDGMNVAMVFISSSLVKRPQTMCKKHSLKRLFV